MEAIRYAVVLEKDKQIVIVKRPLGATYGQMKRNIALANEYLKDTGYEK